MRSLIRQLYNGDLHPDKEVKPNDPQYYQLNQKIIETVATWRVKLTEEEFNELEVLLNLYAQTHEMELASVFKYGFRLGAGIMVEVLIGEENLASKLSTFPDNTP